MKISNFKLTGKTGSSIINYKFTATIDVETGFLFFKKKETKVICKGYAEYWYYLDNGEFTGSFTVEALERSYLAALGETLKSIVID